MKPRGPLIGISELKMCLKYCDFLSESEGMSCHLTEQHGQQLIMVR